MEIPDGSAKSEMAMTIELLNNELALAKVERDCYLGLLLTLYQATRSDSLEFETLPIFTQVKQSLHFLGETGTVPSAYSHPLLRAVSMQRWARDLEYMKLQLGTTSDLIIRNLICGNCHAIFGIASKVEDDGFPCPKCKTLVKFGGKINE